MISAYYLLGAVVKALAADELVGRNQAHAAEAAGSVGHGPQHPVGRRGAGVVACLGIDEQIVQLLGWFDAEGAWAAFLFVLLMAAVVLLLLSGLPFTTGAGFVFGVLEGSMYVVVGTTLGATLITLFTVLYLSRLARRALERYEEHGEIGEGPA